MLKFANFNEKFAILFQFKFCLRAEHYCIDNGEYICGRNVQFIPNIFNPTHVAIRTSNDKNHKNSSSVSLDRTLKCECKGYWPQLCMVHMAQKYCLTRLDKPDEPLVMADKGPMKYNTMLSIVRKLIAKLGLDPMNYGTHSLRSGGTTELHLEGWPILNIQQFVHWESLQSVLRYIRPNNPDLEKFGYTSTHYEIMRTEQRGIKPKDLQLEKEKQLKIQKDVAKKLSKTNYGKRSKQAKYLAAVAQAKGSKNAVNSLPLIPPLEKIVN